MSMFIYLLGAFTLAAGIAWATLAAVEYIEKGGRR